MAKEVYISKKELNELALVKCPKCKGVHFRHAGNVLTYRMYVRHDQKKVDGDREEIETQGNYVYVCIDCGNPWVMLSGELFDGTEFIDVKRFDKVSKALQEETHTDPHC